jgi:hypothetical protein
MRDEMSGELDRSARREKEPFVFHSLLLVAWWIVVADSRRVTKRELQDSNVLDVML